MFKFGANHLYHGKNPTQAFPIGNLAHEMAIANDTTAFGLFVITLGDGYRSYEDYPAWLRPLLPAEPPRHRRSSTCVRCDHTSGCSARASHPTRSGNNVPCCMDTTRS